jgi:hypothetical protein
MIGNGMGNWPVHGAILALWAVLGLCACGGNSNSEIGMCEATQYGVSTSLLDNTAALQAALQSCAGMRMHVAAGTYRFAPALAYPDTNGFGDGITIPDATSIVGDGIGKTTFLIEGPGNYVSFLSIRDVSDVSLSAMTLIGSNAGDPPPPAGAPACYYDHGHAISILSTNRPVSNISITSTELISFTGTSWINVLGGETPTESVGPVTISANHFLSIPGNSVAPEYIVCSAAAVSVEGLGSNVATAANVTVSGNTVDADYIKTGVAVWSGSSHITITDNRIVNAGMGLPVPHNYSNGSYAILVYQQHSAPPATWVLLQPTNVNIANNQLINPYSSGVYVAGARNVRIVGNAITGQVDTYDVTEPRAAIALNYLNNEFEGAQTPVSDNHIRDSAIGISIAGGLLPIVDSNVIESIPSGRLGLKVDGGIPFDALLLTLTNTMITASQGAHDVSGAIGFSPSSGLTIDGLYQTGVAYPLRWYTNIVGTPQQPQANYCSFGSFGSISRVFTRDPLCIGDCWIPQVGYWPNYGVGC